MTESSGDEEQRTGGTQPVADDKARERKGPPNPETGVGLGDGAASSFEPEEDAPQSDDQR